MVEHSVFGLCDLKAKVKKMMISLCSNSIEYEPIKEIYKKSSTAYKQVKADSRVTKE